MTTSPELVHADSGTSYDTVIDVRGLRMRYGAFEAVRGIDLHVTRAEVFAFLGPNGAGKTTTVEILEGYRHRTEGTVTVLGTDPRDGGPSWRARIGVVLQESRNCCSLTSPRPALTLRPGVQERVSWRKRLRSGPDVARPTESLTRQGRSQKWGSRSSTTPQPGRWPDEGRCCARNAASP
jgi:ABC-type Mn2+/Zn2+ transport system ATPase subunit